MIAVTSTFRVTLSSAYKRTTCQLVTCNARSMTPDLLNSPHSKSLFTKPQRTVSVQRIGLRRDDQGATDGKRDTLWQSWLNLRPSVRLLYGISVAVIAVGGLKISDTLREKMPPAGEDINTAESRRKPKLLSISVVDRRDS